VNAYFWLLTEVIEIDVDQTLELALKHYKHIDKASAQYRKLVETLVFESNRSTQSLVLHAKLNKKSGMISP
jgi:hypothetical protein